jgi:ribosomal protein S18 acetylase RimI-like enzyme
VGPKGIECVGEEVDSGQHCRRYGAVDQVTDNRRTGIGRNMVARLCASLPRDTTVYAITRPGNAIAVEFYEGLGFHVLGVLRSFYTESSGVDAVMFGRKAGGPV